MMGACSEGAIESAPDGSGMTRGGSGSMIGFCKVVQTGENGIRPATEGEFSFAMYAQKSNGEPTYVATYSTDANGAVWIDFTSLQGNSQLLTFREVFADEAEAAKWIPLADFGCNVDPSRGANWAEGFFAFNDGPTIVNIPAPEEPLLGEEYSSVTLTNDADAPKVYPGTNHFNYAVLTVSELAEGVTLDMVVGNECTKVGEAFVKLENGVITITIDGVGIFGGFAVTEQPVDDKPNSLIKHNNEPVVCPEGDVIYLYVHFDPVQFYL